MSLLPTIEPGLGDEAQNAFLRQSLPLNLFKTLANAPAIATQTALFGRAALYETELDAQARELAILRAAHLAGSAYEIGHHERIGRDVGLTDEELQIARSGAAGDSLTSVKQLAMRWAEEMFASRRASRGLVEETLETLGPKQAVELSMTVAYYLMVASYLNTFDVPFEGQEFSGGVDINTRPADRPRS